MEFAQSQLKLALEQNTIGSRDAMNWTTPTFAEIKMDAEIGSYQQDSESPLFAECDDAEHDTQ